MKYSRKNQISGTLKVKISLSEWEKDFKPIKTSKVNMDKFEEKKYKEENVCKNTWYHFYDRLINYIPEPVKKQWVVLKTTLWAFLKQT